MLERKYRGEATDAEPREPEREPEAQDGTDVHELLSEARTDKEYDPALQDLAGACMQLEAEELAELLGGPPELELREKRLWMHDDQAHNAVPLFSGQFDLFACRGDVAVIIDYKTGWTEIKAEDNWQLRALVALAAVNGLLDVSQQCYAGIIAPRCSPPVRMMLFERSHIDESIVLCRELARRVLRSNCPRLPSYDACRYCPARPICPEAKVALSELAMTTVQDHEVVDGRTMALLLERCAMAERIILAIEKRAKSMLEYDTNSIPGWYLHPGINREKITDVGRVWLNIADLGISPAVFASHCTMTKTSLNGLLRQSTGQGGKKLDQIMQASLSGAVTVTTTAKSLRRIKGSREQRREEEANALAEIAESQLEAETQAVPLEDKETM
jgi:hypothetical protein